MTEPVDSWFILAGGDRMALDPIEFTAISRALDALNRIHEADPTVLPALIEHRVPCNQAVADDPSVQVGRVGSDPPAWEVGLLGVINGLFGVDARGWGYIAAHVTDDGVIDRFVWTTGDPR